MGKYVHLRVIFERREEGCNLLLGTRYKLYYTILLGGDRNLLETKHRIRP
jgi:hypothetical protein